MTHIAIWIISLLSVAGIITRPFKWPEAVWAVAGAVALVLCKFLSPKDGLAGIIKGTDVYLFLTGMMLLAETAREEKLFDWLAAHATNLARGSSKRLFVLLYLSGILVTIFLSNDATAVVLTPAVAAAVKSAKIKNPLPYLLICAFIANAASFVLPISNPANLVIYGNHMPPLLQWLSQYLVPSVISIIVTFVTLYLIQRKKLNQKPKINVDIPPLLKGGKAALAGIGATALVLLISSAWDVQLGLPTFITGLLTTVVVLIIEKKNPLSIIKGVSWSVLPLVAGLFILVEALNTTGLTHTLTTLLHHSIDESLTATVWAISGSIAFVCNLVNNLPAGLVAGNVIQSGHVPVIIKNAVLIAVDLGPNLSITGSLATILWLVSLRRDHIEISGWLFFKTGIIVMTVTLLFTIISLWL
jgi:arsenical pump membrane protein